MLIRASGPIHENFYLLPLGHSCHYLLGNAKGLTLVDPGPSSHLQLLFKRIEALSLPLKALSQVLITHLHADRIAAIPLLRQRFPSITVFGTASMRSKLANQAFVRALYEEDCALSAAFGADGTRPPPFEEFQRLLAIDTVMTECEILRLGCGMDVRVVAAPGHSEESLALQVLPAQYLITDEGFGYYRGRELATPGGDLCQNKALNSIQKLAKTEITGLCLPNQGVLTGQLARKHLEAIKQNTADLFAECQRAHKLGITDEEILASVTAGFYTSQEADPIVQVNLRRSLDAVWRQVLAARATDAPVN